MTVLNCPRVVNEDGEFESVSILVAHYLLLLFVSQRWFINGTHNCFTEHHALLGLWAIAMLLVCAALIPFLALVAVGKIKVS